MIMCGFNLSLLIFLFDSAFKHFPFTLFAKKEKKKEENKPISNTVQLIKDLFHMVSFSGVTHAC